MTNLNLPGHNFAVADMNVQRMKTLALVLISLLLAGCSGGGPFSALGITEAPQQQIDYSPRPPLAIPPPEQRGVLPPPQEAMPQSLTSNAAVQAPAQTLPSGYTTQAPATAPVEEKSWLQRMFD